MGWLFAHVVGPLAGYGRRADKNLAMIFPDMPRPSGAAIVRASLDNVGRTIIENYSPEDQLRDVAVLQPRGPGWPAIEAARKAKTPDRLRLGPFRQLAGGARGAEPARL
jgi:KDO2-lipid IV(A) lauroyltransferase